MNIVLKKGSQAYASDCADALAESELGRQYFEREGSAKEAIQEGLERGTLYVALHQHQFVDFAYYIPKGVFHSFAYVHLVVVKPGHRGKGIGKNMMAQLESLLFAKSSKLFLVVADYNPDAKRFYQDLGYVVVGEIKGLYRPGITEYLMMKERQR